MSKFILGVDGGATKSHLAVFNEAGNCAGFTTYGPLNHEAMAGSYAELEERLFELLPRVLSDAGVSPKDIAFSVFGMAGADTKAQVKLISDMIAKTGLTKTIVCNDAVLGVPAGCPDSTGICAINGTGFKLAAIDYNGFITDTCGLGVFTDDRGGGSWYGGRTCSEVYNALYRLGRPTMMRDMLFDALGITRKDEYLDVITTMLYGKSSKLGSVEINSIAFKAASQGDEVALGILDESALQYAGAIARLAMDIYFPCNRVLNVAFAGSVFVKQKDSPLHGLIKKHVAEFLGEREVAYTCPEAPPVTGAVILAGQRAGLDFCIDSVKEKVNENLVSQ